MGSGVAFFDMDGDGDADLLFVNGARSGWALPPHDENGGPLTLCRNDTLPGGAPRFVDITGDSGLSGPLRGMGVAVGDHDGDGLTDVYVTAVGGNRLYRNLGSGRFVDVTQPSGTAGGNEDWSTSAAFLDYDRDGDLDLFVCNYVRWSRELDLRIDYQLAGVGRAYGPPLNFPGTVPFLFRNEGNGRFTEVAGQAGLHVRSRSSGEPLAKSLGVVPVDLDQDGWLDLVVANDTVQNFVFRNLGNGTFREIGAASGLALDAFGGTRVSDASFRQILPGGIFPNGKETLSYYNLSAGYNLLPGEVFFGANRAKATSFFLLGGIGSTNFNDQSRQTINLGFGMRLLLGDRSALRLDVRDHVYSLDLLGKRESTQNLEVSAGFSLYF
jgi:outer membrane beta-barrel protein